ncbi:MAG: hypothetical protein OSB69_20050, partial [Alphaproteobacteria bacterium]|nr:hypothetical protein [Alphaproteobacteria bacterium]
REQFSEHSDYLTAGEDELNKSEDTGRLNNKSLKPAASKATCSTSADSVICSSTENNNESSLLDNIV